VSFAIPANTVKAIIGQLRKYGEVRRGWIGANVQDLTPDLAEGFNVESVAGALAGNITPGGPAALAGLAPGDIVTSIDGQAVANARVMQKRIAESPMGKVLAFGILRKGAPQSIDVRVARRMGKPESRAEVSARSVAGALLGLKVEALSSETRRKLGFGSAVEGVVVSAVALGSPAAEAGVKPGDVILEAGQRRVRNPDELKAQIAAVKREQRPSVLIALHRAGEMVFKALRFQDRKTNTVLKTARR
jgi:serine protease Do